MILLPYAVVVAPLFLFTSWFAFGIAICRQMFCNCKCIPICVGCFRCFGHALHSCGHGVVLAGLLVVTLGMTAHHGGYPKFLHRYAPAVYSWVYFAVASKSIPDTLCAITTIIYSRFLGSPELAGMQIDDRPLLEDDEAEKKKFNDRVAVYVPIMSPTMHLDRRVKEEMKMYDAAELSNDFEDMQDYVQKQQTALELRGERVQVHHEVDRAKVAMLISTLQPSLKVVATILTVSTVLRGLSYQQTLLDLDVEVTCAHYFQTLIDGTYITLMERHWYTYLDHVRELMQSGMSHALSAIWLVL